MSDQENIPEEEKITSDIKQSENVNQNISQQQPVSENELQAINNSQSSADKLQTQEMEIHHKHRHDLPEHTGKPWKHYLFEFLMLFLAVTAGFFVENLRDHYIEGVRSKEYAHTLLKDIIKDTLGLHETIILYEKNIALTDTLQQLRKTFKTAVPDVLFYFYSRPALTAFRISFNDATLQQLKNSGTLRYFRNLKLKEKIGEYDNIIRTFLLRQEFELAYVPIINDYRSGLFNYDMVQLINERMANGFSLDSLKKENYHLLARDPALVNRFLNFCSARNSFWKLRIRDNFNPTLSAARELIAMLKQEYNFDENE